MFCCAIAHLVELDTFIHLLMKTLACRAVRWVECSIVAICASAASHLPVSVRAGEASIEYDLLESFAVLPFKVSYERIISFPFWETIFFKI